MAWFVSVTCLKEKTVPNQDLKFRSLEFENKTRDNGVISQMAGKRGGCQLIT